MERANSGNVRIAYEDAGQGEPACVVIHGPIGNRLQLATLTEHLAADHRVIAPDLRGTGESDKPARGYRVADFAEDVLAVCRQAGIRRAVLIGHSAGAAIALQIAAREPSLVAGIVMLDGAILFPQELRGQLLAGPIRGFEGAGWLEALSGYVAARQFDPEDPPDVRARVMAGLPALAPALAGESMRDAMSQDFSDLVAAGTYPLMYIHARVPADLTRLKSLRPDATITSVAGSGHYLTMIVPDQVNAMVDRFLATAVSRTSDAHTARR
ncbi:MAG TPA: alpha/beta hydrolase [Candidatus Dormibacteraeota bacterium]